MMKKSEKSKPFRTEYLTAIVAVLCACSLLYLVYFFTQSDKHFPVAYFAALQFGVPIAWLALIVMASLGLGMLVLSALRLLPDDAGEKLIFASAGGLGCLAIATLLFGLAGLLTTYVFVPMLVLFAVIGFLSVIKEAGKLLRSSNKGWNLSPLWVALLAVASYFLILNIINARVPPLDYDTLEYHLGAPAQYFRAGRVFFISNNVYANFPANMEMLYLFGMVLRQSVLEGAYLGKFINLVCAILLACAVWSFGKRFLSAKVGALAAIILFTTPWVFVVATIRQYITMGLSLFTFLALYAFIGYVHAREGGRGTWKWLGLSAIMTGLAIGCKYTAVLFVMAPIVTLILAHAIIARLKKNPPAIGITSAVRDAAIFVTIAVALASPWLIKNAAYTGNPTYPLLYNVFNSSNWNTVKDARFMHEHTPKDKSLRKMAESIKGVIVESEYGSPLILLFIPLVLLCRGKGRTLALLAVYLAMSFAGWLFFTLQIERFLVPLLPIAALLSAQGFYAVDGKALRATLSVVLILMLAYCSFHVTLNHAARGGTAVAIGFEENEDFLEKEYPEVYPIIKIVNELPGDSKVLFVGEARTFYFERPFVAATVFDTQLIEGAFDGTSTPEHALFFLQERGFTHIFMNAKELMRLQAGYKFPYNGRTRLGMLDRFDWKTFHQFRKKYLVELGGSVPDAGFSWAAFGTSASVAYRPPPVTLYRIKAEKR